MIALLALTGPPAVGKTTLARALANRYDATTVFHLPEVARRLRQDNEHVPHLLVDPDPAGPYGDAVVAYCLRHTFLDGCPPAGDVIVLDGMPASPAQMGCLHALAALRKIPLNVIELTAPKPVLRRRAAARNPANFTRRLATWLERVGQIRNAAVVRHRPYRLVDATADLDHSTQRIWAACATPEAPSAGDHPHPSRPPPGPRPRHVSLMSGTAQPAPIRTRHRSMVVLYGSGMRNDGTSA